MDAHEIAFNFKARYYRLGAIDEATSQLWFVLHGYGQLARYFLNKFAILKDKGICVIAPEGLSRFYLETLNPGGRKNDRVGATWMTRENRLMDIENYISYLDAVYLAEASQTKVPVTVLGFSQGAATASRWVGQGQVKCDRLILWAGIFPPDMDIESSREKLGNRDVYLVYGTRDPFLNDSRFAEMNMLKEKLGITVKEITFEGEHDIDQNTLLKLL